MTTTHSRDLIIKKKEAYVWRVHSLGMGENHNFIPCWYVVDKNTDEIISGGYFSGNNYRSGNAYIPRRKDAKAFIDGYNAAEGDKNPHAEWVDEKQAMGRYVMSVKKRALKGADAETEAFWSEGNEFKDNQGKRQKFSELR